MSLLAKGLLALGGLGATATAGAFSFPDLAFGTIKENAKREYLEGNYDPTDGTRTKSLSDTIGEALLGRGEATDKAVKDFHVNELLKKYGTKAQRLKSDLALDLTPDQIQSLNIGAKTDPVLLKSTIDDLTIQQDKRNRFIESAYLAGYGAEAEALPTNQITGMLRSKVEAEEDEDEAKAEKLRLERELKEAQRYRDDLDFRRQQLLMSEKEMLNNNAFRMEQLLQQNNRLDRQDARDARRDQQAFVALLLQGLNNLQF